MHAQGLVLELDPPSEVSEREMITVGVHHVLQRIWRGEGPLLTPRHGPVAAGNNTTGKDGTRSRTGRSSVANSGFGGDPSSGGAASGAEEGITPQEVRIGRYGMRVVARV